MEIYKHSYKLNKKNMMGRKIFTLIFFIFVFATSASATGDIILNGTSFYISTGESYGLSQGYIISLKSVSNDGSAWIELTSNDKFAKSEIVHIKEFFTYNKTNRTILSLRLDNIYSGSNDTNLVSFFPVYQYIDPDMPAPKIIDQTPIETPGQENNSELPQQKAIPETAIIVMGIFFILFMLYIIRKLW
jgi:hypothetical protein